MPSQAACMTYDVDIICVIVTEKLPFHFKRGSVNGVRSSLTSSSDYSSQHLQHVSVCVCVSRPSTEAWCLRSRTPLPSGTPPWGATPSLTLSIWLSAARGRYILMMSFWHHHSLDHFDDVTFLKSHVRSFSALKTITVVDDITVMSSVVFLFF